MASVTSLGIHQPSALPFLVAEGILPPDPSEEMFTWQTTHFDGMEDEIDEELVTTQTCVVWSRGSLIQRVFRFEIEGETIRQALFARFPYKNTNQSNKSEAECKLFPRENLICKSKKSDNTTKSSKSTQDACGYHANHVECQYYSSAEEDVRESSVRIQRRALVVILNTHAHVFFVSGTSHVVHLPFEVEFAFPLPQGILLQRKISENSQSNLVPSPSVQDRSSGSYNKEISDSTTCSIKQMNSSSSWESKKLFVLNLAEIICKTSKATEEGLPRLFSLIDPLTELGMVVARSNLGKRDYSNREKPPLAVFDILDQNEDLLYVSSEDQFPLPSSEIFPEIPFLLAVTQNQKSGLRTIWRVDCVHADMVLSPQRHAISSSGSKTYRRRSSYGPGVGTGSTTPAIRGRESLELRGSRSQAFKDARIDEGFADIEDDLVLQLNPAFETPGAPMCSSRRVSSLLARADLSTSHDKSTFSELASGYIVPSGNKRGGPSGPHGARSSFGPDVGTEVHRFDDRRPTVRLPGIYEPSLQDLMDDDNFITETVGFNSLNLDDAVRGLRKEMVFTKVCSLPPVNLNSEAMPSNSKSLTKPRVFTWTLPNQDFRNTYENANIVLCIFDSILRCLLALSITIQTRAISNDYEDNGSSQWNSDMIGKVAQRYKISIHRTMNVIDACKIKDRDSSRILAILINAHGLIELSLQTPGSTAFKLDLPSTLALYNPYQFASCGSPRERREGGLKRILSDGPQSFTALQHESNRGRVDIIDNERRRHRIQVQLRPNNPHVCRIIRVCESVIPKFEHEQEPFLRGWWEVISWLRSRCDEELDPEWTAIVVLLFSLATKLTGDSRTETTTRYRKRKGGLLRSSSGANTNLESWETMFSEESNFSTLPTWMQDTAWKWTINRDRIPIIQQPSLSKRSRSLSIFTKPAIPSQKKSSYIIHCSLLARDFLKSSVGFTPNSQYGYLSSNLHGDSTSQADALAKVLVALHLLREEYKLDILASNALQNLAPIIMQIGSWLRWESWGYNARSYYSVESLDMQSWLFDDSAIAPEEAPPQLCLPPSILKFVDRAISEPNVEPFLSLFDIANITNQGLTMVKPTKVQERLLWKLTPRTLGVKKLFTLSFQNSAEAQIADATAWGINLSILETLPEGVAVTFRASISSCRNNPAKTWDRRFLKTVGRDDIVMIEQDSLAVKPLTRLLATSMVDTVQDVHSICSSTSNIETFVASDGSAEGDRQSITRMIFKDDQRFAEAAKVLNPLDAPLARCGSELDWSDTELLEAQQEMVKLIAMRTLSVSLGRGLLFYCARMPLLTEKFHIHGFTLSCIMKPGNITVTADRAAYTEEKVSWAFFHAGVEAGLGISKNARGIDTSWILFNKPQELKNRHAGFLLALGLNGHLKSIAKWVAFQYLKPKHTMTSIGLLLGVSASYLGTMDTLITRLLSVHVTRMLPPGAADLNISPLTQTSGIMGIGLLYCNTQHRRMSEVMLSEMENVDPGDTSSPFDSLRDEGYRLAAGFALGYINLGRGMDLKGLYDMRIIERLLYLAIGTRKVSVVHILDKAAAAATISIALISMKTQDITLARKIDIPDTIHQFDYVRPDVFLLRTVARHLIMWYDIRATMFWMKKHVPNSYRHQVKLTFIRFLNSEDMPFFYIIAGLCFSIGLRYAGTGDLEARNMLCHYLDQFMRICKLSAMNYDGKLSRIAVRNCQDVVALSAACVMSGTGDLPIFRRLRALHGRTDVDTPYGSHLVAHLAIGILFLGGGTHTFGTSNLAIASLLCSFYPLSPNAVLDNKSHLQAFRHFWVLATESRCLVARDADSHRPVSLSVKVSLRNGKVLVLITPCLLPELDTIATVQTNNSEFWSVTLNLLNTEHIEAFKRHQSIYVRRRPTYDTNTSIFSATIQSLNDCQSQIQANKQVFEWIFALPVFVRFDRAERALVLPPYSVNALYNATRSTVIDDRLLLETGCIPSGKSERLWNMKLLFTWANVCNHEEKWGWFGKEAINRLRAALETRLKVNVYDKM